MLNASLALCSVLLGSSLWQSCRVGTAVVTAVADPSTDDLPAGSPPQLPRIAVELPSAPPAAPTRTLGVGDDLQAAIDGAKPGDVIALQPGAVFKGAFTLPKKDGSDWITIETAAAAFPAAGMRVTPATAQLMPVIESDSDDAIKADDGAHHYRFIGLEIRPPHGVFVYNLVLLGANTKSIDVMPHHIVFERCYIHGDADAGSRRGIAMNSLHTAVLDSYFSDFKENGSDSQAIAGWGGPGPFAVINNHLEAAGENLMFGGADPDVQNLVPSDIEIRNNEFFKPLTWRQDGSTWQIKNLLELKNAHRVLIDHNTFDNNWAAAQNGFAILFTPRNQEGGAPWSMVRDVTFTNNILRHSSSGVNISGADDINPSLQTKRIAVRDNVFDDIDGNKWGGSGRLFQILNGTVDVVIEHNTAFQSGDVIAGDGDPSTGFIYRNNLAPNNAYGVGGTNTYGDPEQTLSTYFPNAAFTKNVLIGGNAKQYPQGNFFPATAADVDFVNLSSGDYRLAPNSPFKNAATDGKDIGANITPSTAAPRHRAAR